MKKTLFATALLASAVSAGAAGFVELAVDNSRATPAANNNTAQVIRAGKDVAGLSLGVQVKTMTIDAGGLKNDVQLTVGKQLGAFKPFVGVGHDNGTNGALGKDFDYGLVGFSTGARIGGLNVGGVVKSRVNFENNRPKQTVVGVAVGYPLNKDFEARANFGQSFQDIKEKTAGVSLVAKF
jgi:hypothetical protein